MMWPMILIRYENCLHRKNIVHERKVYLQTATPAVHRLIMEGVLWILEGAV